MLNFDKWLSKQLSVPSYHLNENKINSFTRNDIPLGPVFIDAKVGINDYVKTRHLHKLNFKSITTNIQFKKKIFPKKYRKKNCRFANLKDKIVVKKIAYNSFISSRFHLDKRFPKKIAKKLKSEWVNNYFYNKRGDWMILFEINKKIEGFLLLLKEKKTKNLIIDLIAVTKKNQKRGIATSMINYVNHYFIKKFRFLVAGTQSNNVRAIKFYRHLGFKAFSKKLIFHFYNKKNYK